MGNIVDGKMILNRIGIIVKNEWLISEKIRKNIFLDEFVIMPNHFHGIVIIDNERDDAVDVDVNVETLRRNVSTKRNVSTTRNVSTDIERNYNGKNKFMSNISPKKSSLSHIIRSFKSVVTKNSRELDRTTKITKIIFAWQARFHDRIIRNENELNRIRNYIIKNPEMWDRDRNNGDLWL